jgi:hypothetical protein
MLVEFECPRCKGHLCERWGLKGSSFSIRFSYWHWLLNPGLAFNEIALGQRLPRQMYLCKSCELPVSDRCFLHCSSCETFHDARLWAGRHALGHWFGYFCPACGAEIPCLWNITSLMLLGITLPLWWLPMKVYRPRLLHSGRKRIAIADRNKSYSPTTPAQYRKAGWFYGLGMNLVMSSLLTFSITEYANVSSSLWFFLTTFLVGMLLWLPAGWLYGFAMRKILHRKGDSALHLSIASDGMPVADSTGGGLKAIEVEHDT